MKSSPSVSTMITSNNGSQPIQLYNTPIQYSIVGDNKMVSLVIRVTILLFTTHVAILLIQPSYSTVVYCIGDNIVV